VFVGFEYEMPPGLALDAHGEFFLRVNFCSVRKQKRGAEAPRFV